MKKSKIIIPALGIIALSAAASVSGTMAWFTSNRTVTANVGNFLAVNPSSSLNMSITPGKNTVSVSGDSTSLNVRSGAMFRDASTNVSGTNLTVYKAVLDSTGQTVTGFATVEAGNESTHGYEYTDNVIYAATWSIELTNTASDGDDYVQDVFFDGSESEFNLTGGDEFSHAFRIAFYTSTKVFVWAPSIDRTGSVTTVTHIIGTGETDKGQYTNVNGLGIPSKTGTTAAAARTAAQGQDNFIGALDGGDSVTINCVAWYEGEDENAVNGKTIASDAASVALYFSAIQADEYKAG